MKILFTADLHFKLRWFHWLEQVASDYSLICVAGDLADAYSGCELRPSEFRHCQKQDILNWIAKLDIKTQVAICSGNHDLGSYFLPNKNIISDGQSQILGRVVITSIGNIDPRQPIFELPENWEPGDQTQRSGKTWIWIHHFPPSGTRLSADPEEGVPIREMIDLCEPDIVLSGHHHHRVYAQENAWYERVGKTLCLNPGQSFAPLPPFDFPEQPNYIVIDLETATATWHAHGLDGLPLPSEAGRLRKSRKTHLEE